MLMYLSAVLSGEAAPFWPHVGLLLVSILAAFTVGFGIILESPKYSAAVHRVATWLVLGGIAVESLCTVFLFVFDESISAKQQSTIESQNSQIIALETQAAPRTLSKEQYDILKGLAGKYPAINIASEISLEAHFFASQLSTPLTAAGISVHVYPSTPGALWTGILISTDNPINSAVVEPLFKALSDSNLTAGMGPLWEFAPTAPHDVPLILVGEKYMLNRQSPYFGDSKAAPVGSEKK
jgi:hypothetical protein